jgi:integrase
MSALTLLPGGGQPEPAQTCRLCGKPHYVPCQILRRHLEHLRMRGLADTTIYERERAVIRLARALPVPVLDATARDLLKWRARLDISPGSVAQYITQVREFYAWTVARGLREDNPAAGLPVPKLARRLPRPVSEEDLMAAVAAAPARIRPWLVLAAWCGLRAKEVALLRVESVLLSADPPVLVVAADATKGTRERIVPLSPFVVSELTAAPKVPMPSESSGLPRSGYAFARLDGRRGPVTPNLVSKLSNEHLHGCGIGATIHQLRHRFATASYRASRDLRLVQELLGHADPATTAMYAAYDKPQAVAVVAALPTPGVAR